MLSLCRADEGLHQGAERTAVQQCGGASERTEVCINVCVCVLLAKTDVQVFQHTSLLPSSSGIRHGI